MAENQDRARLARQCVSGHSTVKMVRELALLLVAALACAQAASTGKCTQASCAGLRHLDHYYEELACKPVTKEGDCCPSSYDCSHMASRDKSVCYFKGNALDVRPDLAALDPSVCLAGCFCRQTKEAGAVASLTCAHIECPTLFNPSLIPEGCVATYSSDTCCSDGVLCSQNVTAATSKCEWAGKVYLEGERFYPDEEPCKVCRCQKGFDGTLEGPWCKPVTCGLELHYAGNLAKGCAPVFHDKNKCCPIDWRCPVEDDVVIAAVTSKNPEPAVDAGEQAKCAWGALAVRQGESVSGGQGRRCRCDVPPHVTCETEPEGTGTGTGTGAAAVAEPEQPLPVVEAAEVPPAPVVDSAKARVVRSPPSKITCDNVRCVKACVMENGTPKCV